VSVLFQQVLIIVKYIFQFNFYPWNQQDNELAKEFSQDVLNPVNVFGIEKKDKYAAFDLFLLNMFLFSNVCLSNF